MWLKNLSICAQLVILILAVFLLVDMTGRQTSNSALDALAAEINGKLDKDKEYYTRRIDSVQAELQTYQQTRESRAQLYGERLDKVETVLSIKPGQSIQKQYDLKAIIDNNLVYLEGRINGVASNLDKYTNDLESRVSIVETKVKTFDSENKALKGIRNTNIINNTNALTLSKEQ